MYKKNLNILIVILILVPFMYLVTTYIVENNPVRDNTPYELDIVESSKDSVLINTLLRTMMESMGADRAYLFQFHNGTMNLLHKSFYYYSNTNEVVAPGISPEIMKLQRLPISLLSPTWMPKLVKEGMFFLKTGDETHQQTKGILEDQGIKAVGISKIEYMGHIIGFIGVDYVKDIPENIDKQHLIDCSSMIQTLLAGK